MVNWLTGRKGVANFAGAKSSWRFLNWVNVQRVVRISVVGSSY
ncbi:hypothetical protein AI2686V1_4504 [Klebsiella pneumoniae]|nr:hypothetical protein AI2686V1_4504 [Klebsiella pneumoniae]CAH3951954.1 hypothetical protein AI2686V1_4504 [Klebsiella pneumoniae]